ncbi:Cyclin-dependent kinase C-1 [Porphyridium purpureum]|uniref:[RNA-polymerase]-subunit kinase n=1 Tax=Porphyridium purpureum TaxID=35688 RepID=A0A5J4YUC4_PORPP|nr:Cyclin-dependent kinase C-1 [Porphyridium purpureum]|eukprot:POR0651..scf227_4
MEGAAAGTYSYPAGVVVPPARERRPWVSRNVSAFELLEQVGEGTYGKVWKARDIRAKRARLAAASAGGAGLEPAAGSSLESGAQGLPGTPAWSVTPRNGQAGKGHPDAALGGASHATGSTSATATAVGQSSQSSGSSAAVVNPRATASGASGGPSTPHHASATMSKELPDDEPSDMVALKKVRMDNEREGFPLTAIREIKLLKTLHHENIVNLKEIVTGQDDAEKSRTGKGSIYMVFEYMDHDLTGLMDTNVHFTEGQIKCYMQQLLQGLKHCHDRDVLHRDIKGSNLLINNTGQLKIADFGLARSYGEPGRKYTNRVITLWYRPPELLLGELQYGPAVDLWSVGCLLAELAIRKPLFPGRTEAEQLALIFGKCGPPNSEEWPGWEKLPGASTVSRSKYDRTLPEYLRKFETILRDEQTAPSRMSDELVQLILGLLCLDPSKRLTAEQALAHAWFKEYPPPTPQAEMPTYASMHEFQAKKNREEKRKQMHQAKQDSKSTSKSK